MILFFIFSLIAVVIILFATTMMSVLKRVFIAAFALGVINAPIIYYYFTGDPPPSGSTVINQEQLKNAAKPNQ